MRRRERLSVVIPTLNEGKYLERTLLRLSKIDDLEIIVVDANSKDDTVRIGSKLAKVFSLNKRGIARARNYGAFCASGDIIIFLDADVLVPYDFDKKVLQSFRSDGVVGATCAIMPIRPRFAENVFFSAYNLLIRLFLSLNVSRFKFSRGEFIVIRKKDFIAIGGFNEQLPCMEDHDLSFRLSRRGRIVFIKNLTVFESMRRVRNWGLFRTVGTWFLDFLFFVLFDKTYSKVWNPVR